MSDSIQEINTIRINATIQNLTLQRNAALDEVVSARGEIAVLNHVLENQLSVSKRLADELASARAQLNELLAPKPSKDPSEFD